MLTVVVETNGSRQQKGTIVGLVWLLHSAPGLRPGFFREQVTWLGIISQLQVGSIVNNTTISFKK